MMGHKAHLPTLGDSGNDQYALHPRELFAYAQARAAAEREISVFGTRGPGFRRPALRVEFERIGIVTLVMVHDILAQEHYRTRRDDIIANFITAQSAPPHDPYRRITAHRFGQNHFSVP